MARRRMDYLRSRVTELARPETRAAAEPLALWALRNVRLDGKPFSFDGHEYLRAIYDDTAPHVVLSKATQIGGTVWALLRSIHACAMGLNVDMTSFVKSSRNATWSSCLLPRFSESRQRRGQQKRRLILLISVGWLPPCWFRQAPSSIYARGSSEPAS